MAAGTIRGVTANPEISVKIEWLSLISTSKDNTSIVTATLYYSKTSSASSATAGEWEGTLRIGDAYVTKEVQITIPASDTWVRVCDLEAEVEHNANGTKTVDISADGAIEGTTLSSTVCSGTATLDTIGRASTISISDTWYVGESGRIYIHSRSDDFTQKLYYSTNQTDWTLFANNAEVYYDWVLPSALAVAVPNANSGTVYIKCETYEGSALIGSYIASNTYIISASYAAPTISVSVSQSNSADIPLYICGKSTITIAATASTKYGASIVRYLFDTDYAAENLLSSNTSESISVALSKNALSNWTYKVTVVDSRGNTATATGTVSTVAYEPPTIASLTTKRGTVTNGTFKESSSGACLAVSAAGEITALNNYNAKTCRVEYKNALDAEYTTLYEATLSGYDYTFAYNTAAVFDKNKAYHLRYTVSDSFDSVSKVLYISSKRVMLNFRADGSGMAIGGMSQAADVLEIFLPLLPTGGLPKRGVMTAKTPERLEFGEDLQQLVYTQQTSDNSDNLTFVDGKIRCEKSGVVLINCQICFLSMIDSEYPPDVYFDVLVNGAKIGMETVEVGVTFGSYFYLSISQFAHTVTSGDVISVGARIEGAYNTDEYAVIQEETANNFLTVQYI